MFKRATLTNIFLLAYISCPDTVLATVDQVVSIKAASQSHQQRLKNQTIKNQGRQLKRQRDKTQRKNNNDKKSALDQNESLAAENNTETNRKETDANDKLLQEQKDAGKNRQQINDELLQEQKDAEKDVQETYFWSSERDYEQSWSNDADFQSSDRDYDISWLWNSSSRNSLNNNGGSDGVQQASIQADQDSGDGNTSQLGLNPSETADSLCSGDYIYKDADGNCQKCPTFGCTACSSPDGTCNECEPYKYLNSTDYTCQPCNDSNCQQCDATGECLLTSFNTNFSNDVSIDCNKDFVKIAPESGSNQIKYYLKDSPLIVKSIVTHTYAECPITYTFGTNLDLADVDSTIAPISKYGYFAIQSDDDAYTDVNQSYTVTANPSNPSNSASITYQIDFVNRCSEAVISDPTFVEESYSGLLLEEINISFTATTYTIGGPPQDCGKIVYTLLDSSQIPVSSDNYLQIDASNPQNPKLVGTPTETAEITYYLTSQVGDFGSSKPVPVQVASTDPCQVLTIDKVNVQSFSIGVFTQTGYSQSLQTPLLGNVPTKGICDDIQQELLFAETLEPVPYDLAYLENDTIYSSPQSLSYESQTFDILLRSYLDGLPVETRTEFQLSVTECIPTIFSGTIPDKITYNIHTPTVTISFGEYYYLPDECSFNFQYSFIIEEVLFRISTSAVTFDEETRTFSIQSVDPLQVGYYELTIIATLDDSQKTSHSSSVIEVEILNDCLQDALSNKVAPIPPITYNIGDTPIVLDIFQQTTDGCPITYTITNDPIVSIDQDTGLLTIYTDSLVEDDYTIVARATSKITGSGATAIFMVSTQIS